MSVYSSIDVYPRWVDEIDTSDCDDCNFPCGEYGYCPLED